MRTSLPISLRIWGPYACFTRQGLKVDRVSYDIITPSAARAVFEAIFWKPQISWAIGRIELLKPIIHQTMTVNEVKNKLPTDEIARFAAGKAGSIGLDVTKDRTQRTSTILRDVDYLVHATLTLAPDVPDSDMVKYVQMFYRRAERGQCFTQPYLGLKEHHANFALVRDRRKAPPALSLDQDMGLMLHSVFDQAGNFSPCYFDARIRDGVVEVPAPASKELYR